MSENYQIGELIRADVILSGELVKSLFAYQPTSETDAWPWLRIEGTPGDPHDSYYGTDDLANIERVVAVPVVDRQQVVDVITAPVTATSTTADAVMWLFGQGKA